MFLLLDRSNVPSVLPNNQKGNFARLYFIHLCLHTLAGSKRKSSNTVHLSDSSSTSEDDEPRHPSGPKKRKLSNDDEDVGFFSREPLTVRDGSGTF